MDEIKQKFLKNLESYEKLIKRLKKENYNQAVLESRDLYFAYRKIREQLDRHLANVVLFCKKRMVRDVIYFEIELQKVEQRLKELQHAVSLVNLVGQYLPPLPKIDINAIANSQKLVKKSSSETNEEKISEEDMLA